MTFLEGRLAMCKDCVIPKEYQSFNILLTEIMSETTLRRLFIQRSKRGRRAVFSRSSYNRIGSVILTVIPEEGAHELFTSLRLAYWSGERLLIKC
mmetsp:Transcript_34876/g.6280  ORF Transcript_34876/g.6280 Transcript_34876/m.6280 type:complete len:95 (+) Transcript_34876:3113-3397(+)